MDKSEKFTRRRIILAGFATQAVVGVVDYGTGYELHLDVFYFIPVSICAWYLSRTEVVVSAFVGSLTWGYADIRAGHHYTNQAYWYWNILVNFTSLLILGLVLKSLRDHQKKQAHARRDLEQALADLLQSAAEVQKLQGQLQVVCAWTKRLRVDGRWLTFDEFLQEHLHVKLSHGISPEALDELFKEIADKNPPPKP